jgi:hypothetical protein
MKYKSILIIILLNIMLISGCGNRENYSKISNVINSGLEKNALCSRLPIEVPLERNDYERNKISLDLLEEDGVIVKGNVQSRDIFSNVKQGQGYYLTEQGKKLVQSSSETQGICIRTGLFVVSSIEAVDGGADIKGQPVVNVRAKIKFESEKWFSKTKSMSEAARYWKSVGDTEKNQWLYTLKKSGDEYYFTGMGTKLE